MSARIDCRVVWWVVMLLMLVNQRVSAGEVWRATEQPELKKALERAPIMQTESLGESARGVNVWERWLVPNHNGKTWDVLQIYFKEYYGPTWLYAVDLGTKKVKRQRLADGHQFYLSGRALGFDGKYYIVTPSSRTWSMDMFVYDPATNTMEERGEIVPGLGGEVRPLWTYLKNVLVRIDPEDLSVHVVGKMKQAGWPTFVGNDVYFSGVEQLHRIRNIVHVQ